MQGPSLLLGDHGLMSPFLAPCSGKDGVFPYTHVAGKLTKSDTVSECGFELLPYFYGYLAAHVRLNLMPASNCNARHFAAGTPPRRPALYPAGAFGCARGVLVLERTDDKNVMPKSIDRFSPRLGIL